MTLPLFPLNTVLFPDGLLPLRIFEPRYLDMVKDCARENTEFVVCLIREGNESGMAASHHDVGTACRIIDWETLPDGLLGVTAQGARRVQIGKTEVLSSQLIVGHVEELAEEEDHPLPESFQEWAKLITVIIAKLGNPFDQLEENLDSAAWVSARLTEFLPFDVKVKQRILEIDQPLVRLEHLRESLQSIEHYYSRGNLNN